MTITVGVFEHPGKRKVRLLAYTTWYSPAWEGCCEHDIEAKSGAEAKREAMRAHRVRCMALTR